MTSNEPGVRVFVVHSEERLAFERTQRVKSMNRVRTRLEKLERRVANGKLEAAEKIGAAAARSSLAIMDTAITAGPMPTASFASSSIPSTSPASRLTKANTSSRPRSPIYRRSTQCVFTRSSRRSSALSPISKTSSTCDRSIIAPTIACRLISSSPHWPSCSTARSKEAQDRTPRSLRHRSIDRPQVRACGRHRSWRRHHQALGHPWHSARRRSAARPRHHRPRSADPATTRPDHRVVTNRDSHPRKINRLHVN